MLVFKEHGPCGRYATRAVVLSVNGGVAQVLLDIRLQPLPPARQMPERRREAPHGSFDIP
jgi:hypothetical protein